MNLLIDVGNSRLKWALAEGTEIHHSGAMDDVDETRLAAAVGGAAIEGVWLASVAAPSVIEPVEMFARRRDIRLTRLVSQARHGRLSNGYDQPDQLGVDRWMACVAAATDHDGSIWIADAGTALTLDRIDPDGMHQGGLIVPGVSSMRRTLAGSTELPAVTDDAPGTQLGTSTRAAIANGTRLAASSLINQVTQARPADHRLLTGGQAGLIAPELLSGWTRVPDLVLRGIAVVASPGTAG